MGGMPELTQQKSLLHGLPYDIVVDEILSRPSSWWDCRSMRAVSKGWQSALDSRIGDLNAPKSMFAAIHKVSDVVVNSRSTVFAVSVYDPDLGSWERMPPIPGLPCGAPISARCICSDGKLFVLGGRVLPTLEFLDDVYCMDLRAYKRAWTKCSSMHQARTGFACMASKGKIVVAGGQGEKDLALASVEAYDVAGDFWEELPELGIPRAECTGAVIDDEGIFCVMGGYTIHPSSVGDDGCYDELRVQTMWVNSIEVLKFGGSSWETVESSDNFDVLRSCNIASGVLQRLHPSGFLSSLRKCVDRWTTVDGRIASTMRPEGAGSSDDDEEDEVDLSIMLMGTGDGSEQYVTRCRLDVRNGSVCTTLCKAKSRIGNKTVWQEIQLPFDIIPTVSCCSIAV